MRERILIVDDEAGVRASLSGILSDEGYRVDTVETGEAGVKAVESNRYELALLDVWLPGIDAIETLTRIQAIDPDLPVVVISGHGTVESAVKAVRLGAADFIEKPLSLERILLAVSNSLRRRKLEQEVRALKAEALPHDKVRYVLNRAPKFTDLSAKARVKRMAESLAPAIARAEATTKGWKSGFARD